jgi:hypothetical protein
MNLLKLQVYIGTKGNEEIQQCIKEERVLLTASSKIIGDLL